MTARQEKYRWQQLFQRARVPLFLLDDERRLIFANQAFSELTGFSLDQLRGRICRHYLSAPIDSEENLLAMLAPPLEALAGKTAALCRAALEQSAGIWNIDFLPLNGAGELLAILGRITVTNVAQATADPHRTTAPAAPLPAQLLTLRDRGRQWHRLDHLRSDLPAMRRVLDQVRLAVQTTEPVWISGEPGVGKSWLARVIHNESTAGDRCFLALDCGRLPSVWVLRMLRGGSGATLAGNIYLHEPQFLTKDVQAEIVAWYRSRKESVVREKQLRMLVGSGSEGNADLTDEFHCAFSALHITLPPLRQRLSEIRIFVERLLPRAAFAAGKQISGLSGEAWDVIQTAAWPGNLRELYADLRQACQRAGSPVVQAADLPWYLRDAPATPERPLDLDKLLEQVERRLVLLALERSKQNKSRAAEMLSIWRGRLLRRLNELGIEDDAAGTDSGA